MTCYPTACPPLIIWMIIRMTVGWTLVLQGWHSPYLRSTNWREVATLLWKTMPSQPSLRESCVVLHSPPPSLLPPLTLTCYQCSVPDRNNQMGLAQANPAGGKAVSKWVSIMFVNIGMKNSNFPYLYTLPKPSTRTKFSDSTSVSEVGYALRIKHM